MYTHIYTHIHTHVHIHTCIYTHCDLNQYLECNTDASTTNYDDMYRKVQNAIQTWIGKSFCNLSCVHMFISTFFTY